MKSDTLINALLFFHDHTENRDYQYYLVGNMYKLFLHFPNLLKNRKFLKNCRQKARQFLKDKKHNYNESVEYCRKYMTLFLNGAVPM